MSRTRLLRESGPIVKFFALSSGSAILALVAGYGLTVHWGGSKAVSGMIVGCGLCLLASWFGAIPIFWARRASRHAVLPAVLTSMVLRFLMVLGLTLVVALCGWVDRVSFLIWVGISYVVLLPVDTMFAVGASRTVHSRESQ